MAKIDKDVCREILQKLEGAYPLSVRPYLIIDRGSEAQPIAELFYLRELGLIDFSHQSNGEDIVVGPIKAKARGMDFMADDGGISAILGVVTVRLHEDTLKALIESKIRGSDLPEPEKKRFLDQLRELPGETTKHLVLKLLDAGLENWPKALPLLQNMLGS